MRTVVFVATVMLLTACAPGAELTPDNAAASTGPSMQALRIAETTIIIDGHIDVPYRMRSGWEDVSKTASGDFDYPRAVAGRLNAAFMSIYTPADLEQEGGSKTEAEKRIDWIHRIVNESPDKFAIALSPDDIVNQFNEGLISLPMGMENGSPIEGNLANVARFCELGVRYIGLVHNRSNHLADSAQDVNRPSSGLSDFGIEVVREMNRLGIMVDVSHLSDEAFWDVMAVNRAPVIASHSSVRHFTPGYERNLSDAMIRRLAKNGGIIMINFGSAFLKQEALDYRITRRNAFSQYLLEKNLEWSLELQSAYDVNYAVEHGPFPFATLEDALDHFDYVVQLVGIDHVGIGSDYDGVDDTLPTGLKDVSSYPNLVEGLLRRGYSGDDIRKILSGNLLRVWREVEAVSAANGCRLIGGLAPDGFVGNSRTIAA